MLWKNLSLFFLCILAIFLLLPTFCPQSDFFFKKKLRLGLDLQGGSMIVLKVDFADFLHGQMLSWRRDIQQKFDEKEMDHSVRFADDKFLRIDNIDRKTFQNLKMERVLDSFDILEEKDSIALQLKSSQIKIMRRNLIQDCANNIRNRIDGLGINESTIRQHSEDKIIVQMPNVADPAEVKSMLGKTAKLTFHVVEDIIDGMSKTDWGYSFDKFHAKDREGKMLFLLNKRVEMDGAHLKNAKAGYGSDQKPAVFFEFDNIGASKFGNVTRANSGKILAILVDGEVVTAPSVKEPILTGKGMISGHFTMKEASNLAIMLRSGALPAKMEVVEEKIIGPTIGAQYVSKGVRAVSISFVIVVAIIIAFYRFFGVFASLALFMNVVLILTAMVVLGVTLTLPGMAGIVLTIGMAVDSNILIFERIREEMQFLQSGFIGDKKAVEEGFKNALTTIIDANVTTLICALVLFACGIGPLKSFAIALMIGILISLFTAIFLTRAMIEFFLVFKKFMNNAY